MYYYYLLLDTNPGHIDSGHNDSDTALQEATPTSSVASPPEHAIFFPGSEKRQVKKGNRRRRGQGRGQGRGRDRGQGRGKGRGRRRGRGRGQWRGGGRDKGGGEVGD